MPIEVLREPIRDATPMPRATLVMVVSVTQPKQRASSAVEGDSRGPANTTDPTAVIKKAAVTNAIACRLDRRTRRVARPPRHRPPLVAYVLTVAVLADVAVALPAALVAVTARRMGCPLSDRVSVYVEAVAPGMSVHPLDEQRCHWYA